MEDIENGTLEITGEYEDIHSFVESKLIERSEIPVKTSYGRSRNDQVALDMKLYIRDEIETLDNLLKKLMLTLHRIMKENTETFMPDLHICRKLSR